MSAWCVCVCADGAARRKRQSSSFRFLQSLREVLVTGRRSAAADRTSTAACLTVYRASGQPDTDHHADQRQSVRAKSTDSLLTADVDVTASGASSQRSAVDILASVLLGYVTLRYCRRRITCGDVSFTLCFFVGHAGNKIDEVW